MYDNIKTIRYMGNKNKLLDFIIPEIEKLTSKNDVICDLMSGTCSIAYALKNRNTIYTNDIQNYSYIIGKAIIENNSQYISSKIAVEELKGYYDLNLQQKKYIFFEQNYKDTYFTGEQCIEIDSLRYAIEQIEDEYKKSLYLVSLMYAMNICQSTSGHFAQFFPKGHERLEKIREKSIFDEFLKKADEFKKLIFSDKINLSFNLDYKELFKKSEFEKVSCVYIDTPYTNEQYSRFYHVLETVCKYDNPKLQFKGLYRDDRFMSPFSRKSVVEKEFNYMIKSLAEKNKKVVISYSDKGLLEVEKIKEILDINYKEVEIKYMKYKHSTQGKGTVNLHEVLFIAYN